jgi:hypothetical protein
MLRLHSPCRLRFATALAIMSAQDPALAQPAHAAAVKAELSVAAPQDCATREALTARVAVRSRRIEFAAEGGARETSAVALQVTLRHSAENKIEAELEANDRNGRRTHRRIVAVDCAAAVDALALMITLLLDPDTQGTASEAMPANPPRSASAASVETSDAAPARGGERTTAAAATVQPADDSTRDHPQGAATAAATTPAATTPAANAHADQSAPAAARDSAVTSEAPKAPRHQFALGVEGRTWSGVAPELMPGVGAWFTWLLERGSVLSPSARLRLTHLFRSGLRERLGVADFTLDLASLDACPLRARLSAFMLRPCASASLARLFARGSDIMQPHSRARPLAQLGAVVIADADIAGPFLVQASAGLARPLERDSFAFAGAVFHRVAPLTFELGLALGYRFP